MKRKECLAAFVLALAVAAGTELGRASGEKETAGYILKDCGGVVTVFEREQAEPTAISTFHLPRTDREKLQTGIEVFSREELLSLLEDLGS